MRVKKYVARSLPEATAQIRADLGAQAVILQTRPVTSGGILGLFGRRLVEVLAAVEGEGSPLLPARPQEVAPQRPAGPRYAPPSAHVGVAIPGRVGAPDPNEADLTALQERLLARGAAPDLVDRLLIRARESLQVADLGRVPPAAVVRELARWDLGQTAAIAPVPGERHVVALVGPTGVGKTTSLAKLAAHFALAQRLRVAVFTADTYRIAAVEQLRTYCRIMNVPLEVVSDPAAVSAALARHDDADLVLVDTAGRNHRDAAQMEDLRLYLAALEPHEVHLVLSLTASSSDVLSAVKAYEAVGFKRLLLTKLDEAAAPGVAYNLLARSRKPVSYLTAGQTVPDDIEAAVPDRLVSFVLGDERV